MDNIPQFDLDKAVHDWRERLADSPAFHSSDLDELECHLNDSIKALQAVGLSCSEAFWVAKCRLGTGDALTQEFEKMNPDRVWASRVLWMVVGCLAAGTAYNLALGLTSLATAGIYKLLALPFVPTNLAKNAQILGAVGLVIVVGLLVGFCFLLWRTGKRKNSIVWRFAGWMKVHPVAAGSIAFLLLAFNTIGSMGGTAVLIKTAPLRIFASVMLWRSFAAFIPNLLGPVVLVSLLILTTRKRVAQQ